MLSTTWLLMAVASDSLREVGSDEKLAGETMLLMDHSNGNHRSMMLMPIIG